MIYRRLFYQWTLQLPRHVSLERRGDTFRFWGPLGHSSLHLAKIDPQGETTFWVDKHTHTLSFRTPSPSFFGLFKALLRTKLEGVSRGFLVYLRLSGIGYRATLMQGHLLLKVGYSHDILVALPPGIRIFCLENTLLSLFGVDKNQVSQLAAQIRALHTPGVYKGKGIRLVGQRVDLKTGKRK